MPPIAGIDLGTTNSLMAYVDYRTGRPRSREPGSAASTRERWVTTAAGRLWISPAPVVRARAETGPLRSSRTAYVAPPRRLRPRLDD